MFDRTCTTVNWIRHRGGLGEGGGGVIYRTPEYADGTNTQKSP